MLSKKQRQRAIDLDTFKKREVKVSASFYQCQPSEDKTFNTSFHHFSGGAKNVNLSLTDEVAAAGGLFDPAKGLQLGCKTYQGESLEQMLVEAAATNHTARVICLKKGLLDKELRVSYETKLPRKTVEEILFSGKPDHIDLKTYLKVHRVYRAQYGGLDEATKLATMDNMWQGHTFRKCVFETGQPTVHYGCGDSRGYTHLGIKGCPKVRFVDPRYNGRSAALRSVPDEPVVFSDISKSGDMGMGSVDHVMRFYKRCAAAGKHVYFKGRLDCPPDFPYTVLTSTKPHNMEVFYYAGPKTTTYDHETLARVEETMIQANVQRSTWLRDRTTPLFSWTSDEVAEIFWADHEFLPEPVFKERKNDTVHSSYVRDATFNMAVRRMIKWGLYSSVQGRYAPSIANRFVQDIEIMARTAKQRIYDGTFSGMKSIFYSWENLRVLSSEISADDIILTYRLLVMKELISISEAGVTVNPAAIYQHAERLSRGF